MYQYKKHFGNNSFSIEKLKTYLKHMHNVAEFYFNRNNIRGFLKSYDWDAILQFNKFYLLISCCPKLFDENETHSKIIKCGNCKKKTYFR